jgi:prepilin-type N-terminal cleavage/methylation domain-containing protein
MERDATNCRVGLWLALHRRKAFTLVELLIVIAVIALLAALLLSALAGAKLQAQQTQCVSNLKQMCLAQRLYYEDFGYFQGLGVDFFAATEGDPSWVWLLSPYGLDERVRLCPAATDTNALANLIFGISSPSGGLPSLEAGSVGDAAHAWSFVIPDPGAPQITNQLVASSYAFNAWLNPSDASPGQGFAKSGPPRPSQTPVFVDSTVPAVMPYSTNPPAENLFYGTSRLYAVKTMPSVTIARHGSRAASAAPRQWDISQRMPGMVDVALFDGHVEKSPLENLWSYYWSANWQVPCPRPGLQ